MTIFVWYNYCIVGAGSSPGVSQQSDGYMFGNSLLSEETSQFSNKAYDESKFWGTNNNSAILYICYATYKDSCFGRSLLFLLELNRILVLCLYVMFACIINYVSAHKIMT